MQHNQRYHADVQCPDHQNTKWKPASAWHSKNTMPEPVLQCVVSEVLLVIAPEYCSEFLTGAGKPSLEVRHLHACMRQHKPITCRQTSQL